MKELILVILIMVFSSFNVFAEGNFTLEDVKNPARAMAKIDFDHSIAQFQSLLGIIQRYYPEVSIEDIGFKITYIWGESVQPELPNISLYNFTVGVKNFVKDRAQEFKNFDETLAFYVTSKLYGH